MDEASYKRLTSRFNGHPQRVRALGAANQALVVICYVMYPLLLLLTALGGDFAQTLRFVLVPGISFALLSVFRALLNFPRPYEVLDITPLISKDTQGKSFPSRHVFSIFVIAASWLKWCLPVGVVLCVLGAALAFIRVLGGVHFPRDVIAGALLGLACGFVGYWL